MSIVFMNADEELAAREQRELALAAAIAKRAEIWTLLLVHTGTCAVLHIFSGGRCARTFTGREERLREIAAEYEPAALMEGAEASAKLREFVAMGEGMAA